MEYYHYVNIFETKGLEYILVICFLITLVLFVRNLERPPRWQRRELAAPPGVVPGRPVVLPEENSTQAQAGEPAHSDRVPHRHDEKSPSN